MPSQRVHAATGATNITHQQLHHCRRADDLRTEAVLRPADGIDDGANFLQIAVFANGSELVPRLQQLVLRNSSDARDHLRRVPRVLLPEQLIDAAWMLQSEIVSNFRRKRRWRYGTTAHSFRACRTGSLIALTFRSSVGIAAVLTRWRFALRGVAFRRTLRGRSSCDGN